MPVFRAADIKGFTPAIEPTRSQEIFVLNGKNYVFDTIGPRSAFGNRLLLPQTLGKPEHSQGVRLKLRDGDRVFQFTGDGILEWNESLGGFRIIYETPGVSETPYRWTTAYLDRKLYLCHPTPGILVYDIESDHCEPHRGPGVPVDAIALAENNGRLGVLSDNMFSWSGPGNGMDFTPKLGGGGFQLTAARVSGNPVMITSFGKGFLSWTTGGVMRSEFTGDATVYHHRAMNTEFRPINSFCTARMDDDTVVILDERGLFQSRGDQISPFSALFNEFLHGYILQNNLKEGINIRLEWDELQRLMFVSVSLSRYEPIYERAFVLYPNLDKWGTFDESHFGIVPLRIDSSDRADDYYGYVDSSGATRYWLHTGSRESEGARPGDNLFYPPIQKPVIYDGEEGRIAGSSAIISTHNSILIEQPANYFPPDGVVRSDPILTGLNASIQIGLLRMNGDATEDQMSEMINLKIRSVESGTEDQLSIDYNIVPDGTADQDLNQGSGDQDWGTGVINYINHGLRVIGTIDGVSEFCSKVPNLIGFVQGARYYACSVTGIWHIVEITAEEIGESFHPRTFEITAVDAGRLL